MEHGHRSGTEHLIIQTAFLGDLLLGIPLFQELRQSRPDDKLTLLCRKGLGEILLRLNLVDEVIEVDKSSRESWRRAKATLRERSFEWLICPHESVRSSLLVATLKARKKVGYRNGLRGLVFHHRVARPLDLPEALRQLALLAPLAPLWNERLASFRQKQALPGGQASETELCSVPDWAAMSVASVAKLRAAKLQGSVRFNELSEKTQALVERLELLRQPVVILAPSSVWQTKMWTKEGYIGVARSLLALGYRVLVMGAANEKALCEQVAAGAPGAVSIAGESSLFESAEILALADLLICNDSGAMHVAAISGVPTVSIFGPTVLEFGYRPWQNSAQVVQISRSEMSCRPCGPHGGKVCPLGTHECMRRISAETVLAAAKTFVKID